MLPRVIVLIRIGWARQDRQRSGRRFLMRLLYLAIKSRELNRDGNGLGRVVDCGLEDAGAPFSLASDVVEGADSAGLGSDGEGLGYGGGPQELR